MGKLNLDARRAEATKEPHEVTLGGRVFLFRPTVPIEVHSLIGEEKYAEILQRLLLDPGDWDEFREQVPDIDEFSAILNELYGTSEGESSASATSSSSTGTSLRPTSDTTTPSTSAKPAGGRKRSVSAV